MKTPSDYARSIRFAVLMTLIATASVVQACSSDTIPTDPAFGTPASVSRPSGAGTTQLRLSGTVTDDDGVRVAGVRVTVCSWTAVGPCSATVTDSEGFYTISFVPASGISVRTEKDGYESKWESRNIASGGYLRFDLRIHRIKP